MSEPLLWRLIPEALKQNLRDWVRRTSQMNSSQMLATLYEPLPLKREGETIFFDGKEFACAQTESRIGDVPVPGFVLRKGYGRTPQEFLDAARNTASMLRKVMSEQNVVLDRHAAVLDWGCATGRVLHEFRKEAETSEFWGTDIDGSAIAWAKEHFSPPFHFVTCTVYPHLPFEDRKFSFIYGGSVFTHIRYLEDFWLMELHRILRPGGVIVVTILDESTVKWLRTNSRGPRRIPKDFNLDRLTAHDQLYFAGDDWAAELSFFKAEWIRKSWGQYFDVMDIKPEAEGYQSGVVLVKRESI